SVPSPTSGSGPKGGVRDVGARRNHEQRDAEDATDSEAQPALTVASNHRHLLDHGNPGSAPTGTGAGRAGTRDADGTGREGGGDGTLTAAGRRSDCTATCGVADR